jgi:hypothetical protein
MTKEIQVERSAGALTNNPELCPYLVRAKSGAGERAQTSGFSDRHSQVRPDRLGHRSENDRQINSDEIEEPAVRPHVVLSERVARKGSLPSITIQIRARCRYWFTKPKTPVKRRRASRTFATRPERR